MVNNPCTFDDLAAFLARGRAKTIRPVARNTWVQTRTADTIAVRLHGTDVLTFARDGAITLDAGGWYTMVTKDRINRFLPHPLQVTSHRGRWKLALHQEHWYGDDGLPFRPGMTVRSEDGRWFPENLPDWTTEYAQCAHNTQVEKMLDAWIRRLRRDRLTPLACPLCRTIHDGHASTLVGDAMGNTEHLFDHLTFGVYPRELVLAVMREQGYRDPEHTLKTYGLREAKTALRASLRHRLLTGAVHGMHPLSALSP